MFYHVILSRKYHDVAVIICLTCLKTTMNTFMQINAMKDQRTFHKSLESSTIIEGLNLLTLTPDICSSNPSIKKSSERDAIPHENNSNFIVCLHLARATAQLHGHKQEGEIH